MNLLNLTIGPEAPHVVRVVIEMPRGVRARIEYDPELDRFYPAKPLGEPVPANYGWIAETLADDDELGDIIILGSDSLPSGTVTWARPLALFWRHNQDHKVLAVLATEGEDTVGSVDDLDPTTQDLIAGWFRRHPDDHWQGREAALDFIRNGQQVYHADRRNRR